MRSIAGSTGIRSRPDDPSAEAWAALLRAILCRRGAEQMRADADEAVRRFAAESFVTPAPALLQGIARILCGDLDGGDVSLEDAVSVGEEADAPEDLAIALCERSLVAMARSQWDRAEVLAERARTVLRQAGIEESYVDTPGLRGASPRSHAPGRCPGGAPGTRQCPAPAAFADLRPSPLRRPGPDRAGSRPPRARRPGRCQDAHAGGRRPAQAPARPRNPRRAGRGAPGPALQGTRFKRPRSVGADRCRAAPAAAAVHPPVVPRDRRGDVPVPLTRSSRRRMSIYRKLGASSRSQAVTRSRELGLLEG